MALCWDHTYRPLAIQGDQTEGPGFEDLLFGSLARMVQEGGLPLTYADSFPFGGDDHDLLVDFNAVLISQHTWKHDLGPIADCVHLQG